MTFQSSTASYFTWKPSIDFTVYIFQNNDFSWLLNLACKQFSSGISSFVMVYIWMSLYELLFDNTASLISSKVIFWKGWIEYCVVYIIEST